MRVKNSDLYIFFDDGNTLNDNKARGKQWERLIGKYLSPKFGGAPEIWAKANILLTKDFGGKDVPKLLYENREKSHEEFITWFIEKWINEMFDFVGIERPEKKLYKEIYYGASNFVAHRVKAVFPGVIESIKKLYNEGYTLCTSSGTESIELGYYLEAIGIKRYFKKLYGPDLINILKIDETFYNAIFKDLGITPNQAIIIDDKPYYLKMAEKSGSIVIQACVSGEFEPQFPFIIYDMKNLSKIIQQISKKNSSNFD
ncbi:MAG: HAD family hydrolase [Candidatus Thorarchaeota archaeon]